MSKFFISYSSREPDNSIAKSFAERLRRSGHEAFYANDSIHIGEDWNIRIEKEINSFDYFLVLLSENSKFSDMVTEEIRKAKLHHENSNKKSILLPVRINLPFSESLNYDIDAYLKKFQQRLWNSEQDTEKIFQEILFLIKSKSDNSPAEDGKQTVDSLPTGAKEQPLPIAAMVIPGGLESLDSPFYIERKQEAFFTNYVFNTNSAVLRVMAPRQFGKTSFLQRVIKNAENRGYQIVNISLQLLDQGSLKDLDKLMKEFCVLSAECLNLPTDEIELQLNKIWSNALDGPKRKCEKFFQFYLLKKIQTTMLLAIDEADRLFEFPEVSKEFFSLLRFLNEKSKFPGGQEFQKIRWALAYSSEVRYAIADINQSPFNIGEEFRLPDFTIDEMKRLVIQYSLNLAESDLQDLRSMIGGHPFLIRKSLYLIASGQYLLPDLISSCWKEGGPFDDNLRRLIWYVTRNSGFAETIKNIIESRYSSNKDVCFRLRSMGIIEGEDDQVRIKYKLYENYLKNKF